MYKERRSALTHSSCAPTICINSFNKLFMDDLQPAALFVPFLWALCGLLRFLGFLLRQPSVQRFDGASEHVSLRHVVSHRAIFGSLAFGVRHTLTSDQVKRSQSPSRADWYQSRTFRVKDRAVESTHIPLTIAVSLLRTIHANNRLNRGASRGTYMDGGWARRDLCVSHLLPAVSAATVFLFLEDCLTLTRDWIS